MGDEDIANLVLKSLCPFRQSHPHTDRIRHLSWPPNHSKYPTISTVAKWFLSSSVWAKASCVDIQKKFWFPTLAHLRIHEKHKYTTAMTLQYHALLGPQLYMCSKPFPPTTPMSMPMDSYIACDALPSYKKSTSCVYHLDASYLRIGSPLDAFWPPLARLQTNPCVTLFRPLGYIRIEGLPIYHCRVR